MNSWLPGKAQTPALFILTVTALESQCNKKTKILTQQIASSDFCDALQPDVVAEKLLEAGADGATAVEHDVGEQ